MKSKTTAALFAFFLGGLGVHKFYLGRAGTGLLYLLFCWTWIPTFIAFIEGILLLTMSEQAFNLKYNALYIGSVGVAAPQVQNTNTQAQNITINVPSAAVAPQPIVQGAGQVDVVAQLTKLNELRVAGALTDEEFQREKVKLLAAP